MCCTKIWWHSWKGIPFCSFLPVIYVIWCNIIFFSQASSFLKCMLSSWLVLSTLLVGILILPDSVEQSGLDGQSHEWYKLLVSPLPFFQRLLIVLGSCYEKCENIFHWWYRVTSSSTAARTMVLNAERQVMYLVITQAIMLQLAELINKVSWCFASTIVFTSNKGHTLIVLPSSNRQFGWK